MRRNWLVVLSWCVGFVWAVGLILNARRAPEPVPQVPQPVAVASLGDARSVDPPPPVEIAKPAKGGNYSGNTKTHKFHERSCNYWDCPNCTARFATREDAINAGYVPCGTCKP
ncbi:MAG TPA: hypothetical protein VF787_16160 [Thermoanaerobaculia bacterium]